MLSPSLWYHRECFTVLKNPLCSAYSSPLNSFIHKYFSYHHKAGAQKKNLDSPSCSDLRRGKNIKIWILYHLSLPAPLPPPRLVSPPKTKKRTMYYSPLNLQHLRQNYHKNRYSKNNVPELF